ncbi:MAG: cofactor-independent phosphoglycerate mutase [Lentisphaerae bacterium]|jgi:2,3-bisphosphoglycerate-independent phosphoglycerate mutase|nr:cofactor-independent phosphoglycerate mutase [Lentisphaerota bacterium]
MKYVVLVGDGMGDYPVDALGGMTPLQAAKIPTIRRIAGLGETRLVQTVPEGMPPGSDVANLALLGYDAAQNYTGRAPIEAAGAEIVMEASEVAFRCNLVTVEDGVMVDYSAGHITTEEAHLLVESLQEQLGRTGLTFHPGVQYRHLLVWDGAPAGCRCVPPHEISDKPVEEFLPTGERQDELRTLMELSKEVLADHPVNKKRIAEGKKPATQIWLWGQGNAMQLESYKTLYGLDGGVISAVDLLKGIAKLAGLEAPDVVGATGFLDTNYQGKVDAALEILERKDFVYVHIEAPDECGHMGDAQKKTFAIEEFDAKVCAPILQWLEERGEPYTLILCTDHRTPVALKGHTAEPVPMAVLRGPVGDIEAQAAFDEKVNGGSVQCMACRWIQEILSR